MPTGLFTQSTTLLFECTPSLDTIANALDAWRPERRQEKHSSRMGRGEQLLLPFDQAANGRVTIDAFDEPWPDSMGDPKRTPALFAAWSAGEFGPLVFPGALQRACQQAVAFEGAAALAATHRGFVRVRVSYGMGESAGEAVFPVTWRPLSDLDVMVKVARQLLDLSGALAYFDPNGEVIFPRSEVDASLAYAARKRKPPMDLYTHVRLFNVAGREAIVMDTVGMERFRLLDAELTLPRTADPNDGAAWLRNLSLSHVERGSVTPDGHTIDGPGGAYRARRVDKSIAVPTRPIVRFAPTFVALGIE